LTLQGRPTGAEAGAGPLFKRIAIIIAAMVGTAVAGGVLLKRDEARVATLTAEAPAEITGISVRTDQDTGVDTTVIDYRFSVAGKVLTDRSSRPGNLRGQFPKGARAKACYDPAKTAESDIFPADHVCAAGPAPAAAPASRSGSSEMSMDDVDMMVPD
jgi:hypothetical protein